MRKMFIGQIIFIVLLGCNLFSSSGSKNYPLAEYVSAKGVANPSQETKIELDDGAMIIIPANATNSEVTVTVERNPEKTKNLSPLGDNVVPLGNFYNFDISGGTLIGGVDLVLPFDESQIPDKAGLLTIALPKENGWDFIPVGADGNKVIFYTTNVGDPLIAWHFVPKDGRIDLDYETKEELTVCDEYIHLDVSPESGPVGTKIKITGQVLPVRKGVPNWQESWGNLLNLKTAANVTVKLSFGSSFINADYGNTITTTDKNGYFEATYDTGNLENVGWISVTAKAQCDKWFGKIPVPSEGRINFRLTPSQIETHTTSQPTQTTEVANTPMPTITPIPVGAVLLPDFVGQPIDDAIDWLEANRFKYTWIDGSSSYDLGIVYNQAPAGGQYKVPHRTIVVLYRTTEKIEDTYGCFGNTNLTPEERANCGLHTYSGVVTNRTCDFGSITNHERESIFEFTGNTLIVHNESIGPVIRKCNGAERIGFPSWTKTSANNYHASTNSCFDPGETYQYDVVFTEQGYLFTYLFTKGGCSYTITYSTK